MRKKAIRLPIYIIYILVVAAEDVGNVVRTLPTSFFGGGPKYFLTKSNLAPTLKKISKYDKTSLK